MLQSFLTAAIKEKKNKIKKLQHSNVALTTGLIRNFTVVVLVGGAAEHPPSGPELQDLQQQQTGHGAEALLEQEAVPQQEEQLVHPLAVHLLQLLSDTVQLQHQAVHLRGGEEDTLLKFDSFENASGLNAWHDTLIHAVCNNSSLPYLLLIEQSIWLGQPYQTAVHRIDQGNHRHVVHLNVEGHRDCQQLL